MNGLNLQDAFDAATAIAARQGQISFAFFERRRVIMWMPLAVATAP